MKTCPGCQLRYPDESTFCFVDGQTLQAAEDALIGTTIAGRYRLEELVAETPWARTYRARERLLTVPCVVKLLQDPLDEAGREHFMEVLATARRCSHPNIAEVWGGGFDDGHGYIVEPALEAESLRKRLTHGPLPAADALPIAAAVLRALARVHDFGSVHGSIAPGNLLIAPSGHVYVNDLGVGRPLLRDPWEPLAAALDGQRYLAPEVSSRAPASAAGDLYGVGAVTFHMLSGGPPLAADDAASLRKQLSEENLAAAVAALTTLPDPLRAWLGTMLERYADKRPLHAHQALEKLAEVASSLGIDLAAPAAPNGAADAELDPSFARWERYRGLFGQMLELGFPSGPPAQTRASFDSICGHVDQLKELGTKAMHEHGNARDVLARAREGRESIARQMEMLNGDGKEVRAALEPLLIKADEHGARCREFAQEVMTAHADLVAAEQRSGIVPDPGGEASDEVSQRMLQCHRQAMHWEGRSGFTEPYPRLSEAYRALADEAERWCAEHADAAAERQAAAKQLAVAYRQMAELVDRWTAEREAQLARERDGAEQEERLQMVHDQLEELREHLRVREANLATEAEACESSLAELGRKADALEPELLDLAVRFSAPLRSKPELGACFRELQKI
jgi:serine/threonine-protein kinase